MGDTHFIIRHGLTGFVFLAFIVIGLLPTVDLVDVLVQTVQLNLEEAQSQNAGDGNPSMETGSGGTQERPAMAEAKPADTPFFTLTSGLILAFFSTPVLGVMIQGIHVALMYAKPVAWEDPARIEIARHIRNEVLITDINGLDRRTRDRYPGLLHNVRPDSLFVWLYYSEAQEHMVEWARRRRSYHWLGQNWVLAGFLGFICGLVAPYVYNVPKEQKFWLFLALAVPWAAGTLWISRQMKRDVDDMEFVWALSQLYPEAFRALLPDKRSAPEAGREP